MDPLKRLLVAIILLALVWTIASDYLKRVGLGRPLSSAARIIWRAGRRLLRRRRYRLRKLPVRSVTAPSRK